MEIRQDRMLSESTTANEDVHSFGSWKAPIQGILEQPVVTPLRYSLQTQVVPGLEFYSHPSTGYPTNARCNPSREQNDDASLRDVGTLNDSKSQVEDAIDVRCTFLFERACHRPEFGTTPTGPFANPLNTPLTMPKLPWKLIVRPRRDPSKPRNATNSSTGRGHRHRITVEIIDKPQKGKPGDSASECHFPSQNILLTNCVTP